MDPQATWKTLLDAYQASEWADVEESAQALLAWLDRDGFPPRLDHLDETGTRLVVRVFCSHVLALAPQSED